MNDGIEREIRSIQRQYHGLKQPCAQFAQLDPLAEPLGLRLGSGGRFTFPHEGLLDAVLAFAQSVWHFKDYLKEAVPASKPHIIEEFASSSEELSICADLANEKKHSRLKRHRSCLKPSLGVLSHGKMIPGVVGFDTSRNGPVEFAYDGKTKEHRFWVTHPFPIPWHTDLIVSTKSGRVSKGDAVDLIFRGFKHWEKLIAELRIRIRPDYTTFNDPRTSG